MQGRNKEDTKTMRAQGRQQEGAQEQRGNILRQRRGQKGISFTCCFVAKTGIYIYLTESLRELRSKEKDLQNYDEKMKS